MSHVSNETFRRVLPVPPGRQCEVGPRTRATLIFPALRGYDRVVIANALIARFGGYSAYEGEGGWISPDDGAVVEQHWRFEVSYKPSDKEDVWLQDFAERVGLDTAQAWMHIEFSACRAGHVKVRR